MADGKIEIDTSIETSGLTSGLKKVSEQVTKFAAKNTALKPMATAFNNVTSAAGAVSTAVSALSGTFGGAVSVVRQLAAAADAVTETYKVQAKAEAQLETAAKNNPYLDSSSVKALKQYASALQSVSNVGDEALLPMMAQLAATGRTQAEIQQIMSAALDMSASGAMSLDAAVDTLNKTYAGVTTTLGRTLPEVQSLTDEELSQGKAVEIVAAKYKGLAASVADTKIQMQNAKGDFQEAIGALTAPSLDKWNKFWQGFYEKASSVLASVKRGMDSLSIPSEVKEWAKGVTVDMVVNMDSSQLEEYVATMDTIGGLYDSEVQALSKLKAGAADAFGKAYDAAYSLKRALGDVADENGKLLSDMSAGELTQYITKMQAAGVSVQDTVKQYRDAKAVMEQYSESEQGLLLKVYSASDKVRSSYDAQIEGVRRLNAQRTAAQKAADAQAKADQEAAAAAEDAAQAAAAQAESEAKLVALRQEYAKAVADKQSEIATRRELGEVIDGEAEAQQMCNTAVSAFVKLKSAYAEAGGDVQDLAAELEDAAGWQAKLNSAGGAFVVGDVATDELADALAKIEVLMARVHEESDELFGTQDTSLTDLIKDTIAQLEVQREAFGGNEAAVDAFNAKIAELESLLGDVEKAEAKLKFDDFKATLTVEVDADLSEYEKLLQEKADLEAQYAEQMRLENVKQAELTGSEIASIQEEYAAKMQDLNEQIADAQQERYEKLFTEICDYTEKTASIVSDACDVMTDAIDAAAESEKETLKEKYEAGLISEEEYEAGIEAIEKEAAMKSYKIEMANWAAQLLEATASIALGCARSLEKGMPQGAILAALTAAAGAVQIASITAAKPQKPSFAKGGVVPGTSYTGDKVEILANSGEAVLTRDQQQALRETLSILGVPAETGKSSTRAEFPITVNNTQADKVGVKVSSDGNGARLDVVNGMVQYQISNGSYHTSFKKYDVWQQGKRYV